MTPPPRQKAHRNHRVVLIWVAAAVVVVAVLSFLGGRFGADKGRERRRLIRSVWKFQYRKRSPWHLDSLADLARWP